MAKKTIKVRLFTWFEEQDSQIQPGQKVLVERIAHLGDVVDITSETGLARGEQFDAFFSDEDAAAIEEGTYRGASSDDIYRRRAGIRPPSLVEDMDGEGPQGGAIDVNGSSASEIAEYIRENKLTVHQVKDLVPDDADEDTLNKLYDAETEATDSDPRKGVTDYLDARLAAAAQQSAQQ